MRIGVLTAGGDCPGLNAAIRAVARSAMQGGDEAIGIRRGYRGLAEDDYVPLDMLRVSGILHQGGTILSTSSFEPIREGAVDKVAGIRARCRPLICNSHNHARSVPGSDPHPAPRRAAAPGFTTTGKNHMRSTGLCL